MYFYARIFFVIFFFQFCSAREKSKWAALFACQWVKVKENNRVRRRRVRELSCVNNATILLKLIFKIDCFVLRTYLDRIINANDMLWWWKLMLVDGRIFMKKEVLRKQLTLSLRNQILFVSMIKFLNSDVPKWISSRFYHVM